MLCYICLQINGCSVPTMEPSLLYAELWGEDEDELSVLMMEEREPKLLRTLLILLTENVLGDLETKG